MKCKNNASTKKDTRNSRRNYKIDIAAIQEIMWNEQGEINKNNLTLKYSEKQW